MVGIHVVAHADIGKLELVKRESTGEPAALAVKGIRDVDFAMEGVFRSDIYDGAKLSPGMRFTGPAIIEEAGMTAVVHPGNKVEIDGYGNIRIEVGQQET